MSISYSDSRQTWLLSSFQPPEAAVAAACRGDSASFAFAAVRRYMEVVNRSGVAACLEESIRHAGPARRVRTRAAVSAVVVVGYPVILRAHTLVVADPAGQVIRIPRLQPVTITAAVIRIC